MKARSSEPCPGGPIGASRSTSRLEYDGPAHEGTATTAHASRVTVSSHFPAMRRRSALGSDRLEEQRPDRDQHRQRRGDHQRLGLE